MNKKKGIIILTVSVILILIAFFSRGIIVSYFSNYGDNFKSNLEIIASKMNVSLPKGCQNENVNNSEQYKTEEEIKQQEEEEIKKQKEIDNNEYSSTNISHTGKNIAMEYAASGRFSEFDNGVICVTETVVECYSESGDNKWSIPIQISSPVLGTAGKYILVYEKNGRKLMVFEKEKKIFSKTMEGTIKTASISSGGDVSIVYEREGYKGSVMVCNKDGKEVYLWNSGKYSILDADMSQSRRLAVSLLNTESDVSSKIYFFDIGESDVDKSVDLPGCIAFDIIFDGNELNVFADNKIIGLSCKGKASWTYESEGKNITKYAMTNSGTKVVSFDKNNASELTLITSSGREKGHIKTEVLPDVVDISNDRILYNDGRTLIITSLSSKVIAKYICSRDVKNAYIINNNYIFIVYNSSVEFLNIKGD